MVQAAVGVFALISFVSFCACSNSQKTSTYELTTLTQHAVGPVLKSENAGKIAIVWREQFGNKAPAHLYVGDKEGHGTVDSQFTHGTPRALYFQGSAVRVLSTIATHDQTLEVRIVDEKHHVVPGPTLVSNHNQFSFDANGNVLL